MRGEHEDIGAGICARRVRGWQTCKGDERRARRSAGGSLACGCAVLQRASGVASETAQHGGRDGGPLPNTPRCERICEVRVSAGFEAGFCAAATQRDARWTCGRLTAMARWRPGRRSGRSRWSKTMNADRLTLLHACGGGVVGHRLAACRPQRCDGGSNVSRPAVQRWKLSIV